jgi:hypothetical protein
MVFVYGGAIVVVTAINFLKACYWRITNRKINLLCALVILAIWNYLMAFHPDSLLNIMPWWFPLVIDFALGFLAFYALMRMTIELINK